MGRLGTRDAAEATRVADAVAATAGLRLAGAMTHLATADEDDPAFMHEQLARFRPWAEALAARRPGVLAHAASSLAAHEVSVAQLVQRLEDGRASLELVLHEAPLGALNAALAEIGGFPEVLRPPFAVPVVSERPL
jgi:D-serine deaminase-like pyridoxal phosphate-dependent protein